MKRILVTGAGGFIGDHLVRHLKATERCYVLGVDLKEPEFRKTVADHFLIGDLRDQNAAFGALMGGADDDYAPMSGMDEVYALAANMGGMGYISSHHVEILESNLRINLNTACAARATHVKRVLFSSSACVYPNYLQTSCDFTKALRESEAYPADPQDAYGWEKLTTERLLTHYANEGAFGVRIARFHNIFGPFGTWRGGREKAPAAFCRKVAEAKLHGEREIEVWGDGRQTRSFCYVDDCVEALTRLMASEFSSPLNVGQDRAVTMDELALMAATAAGWPVELKHVDGPQGVRGRNSNNELAERVLDGWRPRVSLEDGMRATYAWVEAQVKEATPCLA